MAEKELGQRPEYACAEHGFMEASIAGNGTAHHHMGLGARTQRASV